MLGPYPACPSSTLLIIAAAVCCIAPAHAQSTSSPNDDTFATERSQLAGSFASEKLWVWQQRLNLQHWNVSVVVSRTADLKPRTFGNITWDNKKKAAVIRVLDPADYNLPFDAMLRDIELTVVHELIHLEMAPVLSDLQRTVENRRDEESAVNHLAEALLRLDRGR